jgi:hypothetical protein
LSNDFFGTILDAGSNYRYWIETKTEVGSLIIIPDPVSSIGRWDFISPSSPIEPLFKPKPYPKKIPPFLLDQDNGLLYKRK